MLIVVGVIALIACGIALVLLPLHLPWPQRVRWIVAANAMGGWGVSVDPVIIREVFVVDLYDHDPPKTVIVRSPAGGGDSTLLLPPTAQSSTMAQLARWRAAGTPLLLVADRHGRVSLHGPTRALGGLSALGSRSQEVSPWSTA